MTEPNSWFQLAQRTTAVDIVRIKQRNVISVESTTPLHVLLAVLKDNNILGAPVVDPVSKEIKGFVDVLDIAGYIIKEYRKHSQSLFRTGETSGLDHFLTAPTGNVINFSNWNDPVVVLESTSVSQVIEALVNPSRHWRVHRVAVLNMNNELVNVLSQWDILAFLHHNINTLPEHVKNKTVGELNLAKYPIMVRLDTPFADALNVLYDSRVSGIALVDQETRLSGNLSASDLRGINPTAFDFFSGSTIQFLCKGTDTSIRTPIICTTGTSFQGVVALMFNEHVHRVYVVDTYSHPIGVISLSDILQLLI